MKLTNSHENGEVVTAEIITRLHVSTLFLTKHLNIRTSPQRREIKFNTLVLINNFVLRGSLEMGK